MVLAPAVSADSSGGLRGDVRSNLLGARTVTARDTSFELLASPSFLTAAPTTTTTLDVDVFSLDGVGAKVRGTSSLKLQDGTRVKDRVSDGYMELGVS